MMRGDQTMIPRGGGQSSSRRIPVSLLDQRCRRVVLVGIQRYDTPITDLQSVHWQTRLDHGRQHIVVTCQAEHRRFTVAAHGGLESLVNFHMWRMHKITAGDDGIGLVTRYRMLKHCFQCSLGIYVKQGFTGSDQVTI